MFMKTILYLMKQEFKYLHHSKIIYLLIIIVTSIMLMVYSSQIGDINRNHKSFYRTVNVFERHGVNVEEALKRESLTSRQILPSGSTLETTDNPLRFGLSQVGKYLNITNPNYFLHSALELLAFLMGPLIFGIYGAHIANYDYKHKLIKVKAAKVAWAKHILAKQIVSLISIAIIIGVSILIVRFLTEISFEFLTASIDKEFFATAMPYFKSSILTKILACILGNFLFSTIGFTIALISKSLIVPTVVLFTYNIFVPSLGKYDIRNIFKNIGHEIFEFHSTTFQLLYPEYPVSFKLSVTIIFCIMLLLLILNWFIAKNQTKYIT